MEKHKAVEELFAALRHAEEKWPGWGKDPVHAVAVLAEEAGELVKAANEFYWENGSRDQMIKEAAQVGAMALRFLIGMDDYEKAKL